MFLIYMTDPQIYFQVVLKFELAWMKQNSEADFHNTHWANCWTMSKAVVRSTCFSGQAENFGLILEVDSLNPGSIEFYH